MRLYLNRRKQETGRKRERDKQGGRKKGKQRGRETAGRQGGREKNRLVMVQVYHRMIQEIRKLIMTKVSFHH